MALPVSMDLLCVVCGAIIVEEDAAHARGAQAHQPEAQVGAAVAHDSARRDGRFRICAEGGC